MMRTYFVYACNIIYSIITYTVNLNILILECFIFPIYKIIIKYHNHIIIVFELESHGSKKVRLAYDPTTEV